MRAILLATAALVFGFGPLQAAVSFDARAAASGCASGDCAAQISADLAGLKQQGASPAEIDEAVAALAGELVALAIQFPALAQVIAAAMTAAAAAASPGSAVAQNVAAAAEQVAAGNAASLSPEAVAAVTPTTPGTGPTAGENGSDS